MIFAYHHKVTIDNNSIVFTWSTQGIYYHKTYTDVKKSKFFGRSHANHT